MPETEEVKVFETHIIPDTEDDDDSEHQTSTQIVTTHSTHSPLNSINPMPIPHETQTDFTPEAQMDSTDLAHIIPDDPELKS